ncbi:hypothetical protein FRC02_010866 [Tulasnella sp. 418]|nr:hypothetical protein FRC02_010866 [Tulasnella sp. 418]
MDTLWLDTLTISEIIDQFPKGTIPSNVRKTRVGLYEALRAFAPDVVKQIMAPIIEAKRERVKSTVTERRTQERHRKRPKATLVTAEGPLPGLAERMGDPRDPLRFMEVPTAEEKIGCHRDFLNATSNKALRQSICASCAREMFSKEVTELEIEDLPNPHVLHPSKPHPAHHLTNGMLLEGKGIVSNGNRVMLCSTCLQSIRKGQ